MKKILLAAGLLVNVALYAQIGVKAQQNKLNGVWVNNQFGYQMTLMLNEDGSGEFDGESIKYSVSGNKLTLVQSGVTTQYNFALAGNSLSLSGGDIDGNVVFSRSGQTDSRINTEQSPQQQTSQNVSTGNKNLIGTWSGYGETLEFKSNGQCNYLGQTYPYQVSGGNIILLTAQGNVTFGYSVTGNQLSLTANGKTVTYAKGAATTTAASSTTGGGKRIAPELVGKWCYVNVSSTYSGGSSTERCITLNGDGTYEYYSESSRSVNTDAFSGGTNSQGSDRGTWSYDGARIYYNSQTGQGSGSYSLEKRNHPKNNDPMIVLDGETYVTYFQKASW